MEGSCGALRPAGGRLLPDLEIQRLIDVQPNAVLQGIGIGMVHGVPSVSSLSAGDEPVWPKEN